jgi:hypothetical protein
MNVNSKTVLALLEKVETFVECMGDVRTDEGYTLRKTGHFQELERVMEQVRKENSRTETNEVNQKTGLDPLEQDCMDGLVAAYNAFSKTERQHPDEMRDVVDAIHRIQDILAVRVIRRLYPEGWPTHIQKNDIDELRRLAKEVANGNFNQADVIAKAKELSE